jgi:hypothetical protein
MNYNSKKLPKKIASKVARRKKVRYHNDAALFPDNNLAIDRKRRKSVKKLPKPLIVL